jgi:FMN reductase
MTDFVPFIVGLGGTTRSGSTSELALRFALRACERAGARTAVLVGRALQLPMYAPEQAERSEGASELVSLCGKVTALFWHHRDITVRSLA